MATETLELTVLRKGRHVTRLTAAADPGNPKELEGLLADAVRRDGRRPEHEIGDYEMQVRRGGRLVTTFVARPSGKGPR